MDLCPNGKILLIDDEVHLLTSYGLTLNEAGFDNILLCSDPRELKKILETDSVSLIFTDLTMPFVSGQEILSFVHADYPGIPVIIITGNDDIETAVECMKEGAFDYLLKPIEKNQLVNSVKRALQIIALKLENKILKQRMLLKKTAYPDIFKNIITQNTKMHAVFQYLEAVANSSEPVLISGETGTGKEMIAKAYYDLTGLKGNFVTVNVAGLDDQMFTDTLYGHTKGAFTDAVKDRAGLIEKAAGGVLFLDEIGDLSIASQVKLLRVLQENEYYPIGSDVPRYSNAKIVVATNKDLYKMQLEGTFRRDLYYRLSVHNVTIPALRERKDDLPLLIEHFTGEAADQMNKPKPAVPYELFVMLSSYGFPGNIRELRAMIYDAVAANQSDIMSLDTFKTNLELKNHFKTGKSNLNMKVEANLVKFSTVLPSLKDCQLLLIKEAMKRAEGNQSIAAKLLGITRQGLNKRLKTIDLDD
ncbi:MAG: two-component system response regulator [Candidatus Cloacimonadota bacterium]|nr:MAG: two-component system response regulator [Candidatus Cloacimonadota bacterium]